MSFMMYIYQIIRQVCFVKVTQKRIFYSENNKYSLKSLYTKKLRKICDIGNCKRANVTFEPPFELLNLIGFFVFKAKHKGDKVLFQIQCFKIFLDFIFVSFFSFLSCFSFFLFSLFFFASKRKTIELFYTQQQYISISKIHRQYRQFIGNYKKGLQI